MNDQENRNDEVQHEHTHHEHHHHHHHDEDDHEHHHHHHHDDDEDHEHHHHHHHHHDDEDDDEREHRHHHHHHHRHHHHRRHHGHHLPTSDGKLSSIFYWAIFLNLGYVILEAVFGFTSGSMGLLSDAGHNLSDVASLLIALLAFKASKRPASPNYSYGLGKSTIGASLINAVILYVAVIFIVIESVERFLHPTPVDGREIAWVAGAGVIVNGVTAWMLMKYSHNDLNVKGAFMHMLADTLVSVGVVASGIVISFTNLTWLDPAVGILIAIMIAVGSWSLLRKSLRLALDGVPEDVDIERIGDAITSVPEVKSFHHLHVWAMSTTGNALTVHVLVDTPDQIDAAIDGVRKALADEGIAHSTIEAETSMHSCGHSGLDTLMVVIAMFSASLFAPLSADAMVWYDGQSPVTVSADTRTDLVVGTAIDMFVSDMEAVTGKKGVQTKPGKSSIVLTQLDRASKGQRKKLSNAGVPVERLDTLIDGFNITVAGDRILVTGTNGRGTAYGLLQLSREAGVSPWIWWGDVTPARQQSLTLPDNFTMTQGASVEYRGIFLNDEDWSLRPWSSLTFEPNSTGTIGPRTNKEIFKLLMRLRGNAVWPAMHPGTRAFFRDPANKLVADSCGIAVGSSHCEPLLRNNVDEWDEKSRGRFNYMTNRQNVQDYWIERLKEVKGSEGGNMFTIGMRGIHDGSMEGVKTEQEKFDALQQVIDDQQELLRRYVGDPAKQMQVFVPYKEVLELYERGLKIPETATLMWCDDNYGYITRLSTPEEQKRPGGGGVYYHLSYWGRPHDYLWLTTTQPGLIYNEMRNAFDHNVRKLWIANVHDPKAAAYDLQLFLDLAWDINSVKSDSVGEHLKGWLTDNFGEDVAETVYPAMRKYYNLTAKRRPEFMGWSQTELDKRLYNRGLSPVSDTEFSFSEFGGEADRYMEEYLGILEDVEKGGEMVDPRLRDAFFAAVVYPVSAAANNAVKMLEAQRARSYANGGSGKDIYSVNEKMYPAVARSQKAYSELRWLTDKYNEEMSGGKWRRSMNMRPRDLPSGGAPSLPVILSDTEVEEWLAKSQSKDTHALLTDDALVRNAAEYSDGKEILREIDLLGHSNRAVELSKGGVLTYEFNLETQMKAPLLTTALIPTQPNDGGNVRFSVSVDGADPVEFDLKEAFRSEGWKKNVLRGQALRSMRLPDLNAGRHTVTVKAIDPHIVVDQICLDPKPTRRYYLLPTAAK